MSDTTETPEAEPVEQVAPDHGVTTVRKAWQRIVADGAGKRRVLDEGVEIVLNYPGGIRRGSGRRKPAGANYCDESELGADTVADNEAVAGGVSERFETPEAEHGESDAPVLNDPPAEPVDPPAAKLAADTPPEIAALIVTAPPAAPVEPSAAEVAGSITEPDAPVEPEAADIAEALAAPAEVVLDPSDGLDPVVVNAEFDPVTGEVEFVEPTETVEISEAEVADLGEVLTDDADGDTAPADGSE